jgi:hypothetical protein
VTPQGDEDTLVKTNQTPTAGSDLMERALEKCFQKISASQSDGKRLFFPNGIGLIKIGAKTSAGTAGLDFEITIAGVGIHEPTFDRAVLAPAAINLVEQACIDLFEANKDDCSKFAKAIASRFRIDLIGQADDIFSQIQQEPWTPVPGTDLEAAANAAGFATQGYLVMGALRSGDLGESHGHVVVVVAGPLVGGSYPLAYWGSIDQGHEGAHRGVNYAFRHPYCDRVRYGWIAI